jgi:peroxiredoxin Q/BCP
MKLLLLTLAAGLALHAQAVAPPKTHLKVGDTAPDFKLRGSDGKTHTLSEYKGKKMVVLAFFPMAFTGG